MMALELDGCWKKINESLQKKCEVKKNMMRTNLQFMSVKGRASDCQMMLALLFPSISLT